MDSSMTKGLVVALVQIGLENLDTPHDPDITERGTARDLLALTSIQTPDVYIITEPVPPGTNSS